MAKKETNKHRLSEAVSIVSHQLKTPLSAIKGYVEVLLMEDLGELNNEQKEYLRDVLENTEQMIGLINDFLDVAQIESDHMDVKIQKTDVVKVAKEVVNEFSFLARAKNCELNLTISDKIPLVETDPLKIKQVIGNLISNAIHYNVRKGKVEVSFEKKGNNIIFCCEDTGIGIREEEKEKIFTKFYRSERAVSSTTSGSGLGLFISKAVIEKLGGKIWFDSTENKGSLFCFSLPVK